MTFAYLVLGLLILAACVWATRKFVPDTTEPIKTIIIAVFVIAAVVLVFQGFGIWDWLAKHAVPRV